MERISRTRCLDRHELEGIMTYELEGRAAHPLSGLFQSADFPLADLIPSDALEAVFGGLYYTEARAYPSGDSSVFDVHVAF